MVVIITNNVSSSVKGYISRWLTEAQSGVFVGSISTRVRKNLWSNIIPKIGPKSSITMIYNHNNLQKFNIETYGPTRKKVRYLNGLVVTSNHQPVVL